MKQKSREAATQALKTLSKPTTHRSFELTAFGFGGCSLYKLLRPHFSGKNTPTSPIWKTKTQVKLQ